MSTGAARLRGMSVRKKLILVAVTPVVVTSGLLLALFLWAQSVTSRAHEDAIAWERHARALQHLDWAAQFYFDSVADRIARGSLLDAAGSFEALARARAESLWLSRRFSEAEQADEQRLDAHLLELVHDGERVGRDWGRLGELATKYRDVIAKEIRSRVEREEEGSARALRAADAMFRNVRVGGLAIALLALLAAGCASMMAVRGFGKRVAALEAAAARVAAGHFEGTVPVTSGDELGRLARSLNTMVEALRRQRSLQLEFLAAVAHDLKNPLGAMDLSTQMLVHKPELPPEPIVRQCLAIIHRQVQRLRRMVEELLDATTIEAGQLKLAPRACDLAAVAREAIEIYAGTSPQHELRLSVPAEPVTMVCDPTRISRVLDNLVNNAIKYSPAGGAIDVTLTAGPEEVILAVEDHGLGIEPEMLGVIFEPFRRGSPSKDVLPGVGLGLSTCRRIVAAHGGRIHVTSEPGRRTTFRVHLPRRTAADPEATPREGRA